jgi:hypothetical protein
MTTSECGKKYPEYMIGTDKAILEYDTLLSYQTYDNYEVYLYTRYTHGVYYMLLHNGQYIQSGINYTIKSVTADCNGVTFFYLLDNGNRTNRLMNWEGIWTN